MENKDNEYLREKLFKDGRKYHIKRDTRIY